MYFYTTIMWEKKEKKKLRVFLTASYAAFIQIISHLGYLRNREMSELLHKTGFSYSSFLFLINRHRWMTSRDFGISQVKSAALFSLYNNNNNAKMINVR